MTAIEFAEKVNTAYPTVAKWLRDGRVPGAFRHKIGNMEIWMIPGDVLKDFVRPKMGRPVLTEEEKAARAKKKATKTTSAGLLFKSATATKPKAKAGQAVKRVAKKGAQKK